MTFYPTRQRANQLFSGLLLAALLALASQPATPPARAAPASRPVDQAAGAAQPSPETSGPTIPAPLTPRTLLMTTKEVTPTPSPPPPSGPAATPPAPARFIVGRPEHPDGASGRPWRPAGRDWRTYTNTDCIRDVAPAGDYIWVATCGGLVRWNPAAGTYVKYTAADGLAHNDVTCIAVDRSGHLWAGTAHGVSAFDGQTWRSYTTQDGLAGNYTTAIAGDQKGYVWVGSQGNRFYGESGGVSVFDGQIWTSYTPGKARAGGASVSPSVHTLVSDKANHIWVGTSHGIREFDGATWTTHTTADGLPDDHVRDVTVDQAGRVWAVFDANAVSMYDGQTWQTFIIPNLPNSSSVQGIVGDLSGRVWIFTTAGVTGFDGTAWTAYRSGYFASGLVFAMAIDETGSKWFGAQAGLSKFDGRSWIVFVIPDDLADNHASAIASDENGHIWINTPEGLSEFDGESWRDYARMGNRGSTALASDAAGQIWRGTTTGLQRFDGATWTTYTTQDGLADNYVTAITLDEAGYTWVGTRFGLSRYDGRTWTSFIHDDWLVGAPGNDIVGITSDRTGHIWVASSSGISQFDGQTWTPQPGPKGVTAILTDHVGHIWVGGGSGVIKFDGQSWTRYSIEDGLASNDVLAMASDPQGHIWVGTAGYGVSRFDGQTWTTFTTQDGLADNVVTAITVDQAGHTWFATEAGVSVFDDAGVNAPRAASDTMPTPWLPRTTALPPDIFQVGGTDLALLYVQDGVLFRHDLPQQTVRTVSRLVADIHLSPNGQYLAFTTDTGLYLLDMKSRKTSRLHQHFKGTQADPARVLSYAAAGWSSPSTLVIDVVGWEASGSGQIDLAGKAIPPYYVHANSMAWSPDGRQLAVSSRKQGCADCDSLEVIYSKSDISQTILKGEAVYDLAWSPDGARIAFTIQEGSYDSDISPIRRLYLAHPDGTNLTQLTDNAQGQVDSPTWAADGTLYYDLAGVPPGGTGASSDLDGIYRYDPIAQTHTLLVPGGDLISLSPGEGYLLFRQNNQDKALQAWSVREQRVITVVPASAQASSVKFVGWLAGEELGRQWYIRTLLVAPGEPGRLYALLTDDSADQLVISDDWGETWSPFAGGLPVEADCLHTINLDYATLDALYASTCQGLYRWSGSEWTLVSTQETSMVAVVYGQPEAIWATQDTVLSSDDRGQTWRVAAMGLPIRISAGIAVDPRNANILYLTVWSPYAYNSGILYRGNAAGQWSRIPTPDSVPNTPAINYRSNMVLDGTGTLHVTTHGYKLWRSQNADALDPNQVRWELVREFSPDVSVQLLASGWGPSGLALYASIRQGQNKPTLHRSLDGGQTWAPLKINF